ncbi:DEAD-box ATP-dependent RNA helicase 13 [Iris pallida]|uniref:ATP-dependent RNA helicase n=1 Tax=Iris pallida TaxID=29817 RepID=A0AAX6FHC5_IRIPA|nr:DEAD-box ATP-dependent RNA helicase 13 [Iris pallida]
MSSEKQERLLKRRPEIIVGTPGRLWELMSGGNQHLVELHSLSFFVLDEADRMIENGHFRELQSIIDMLPATENSTEQSPQTSKSCKTIPNLQRKKRQTFVFSATIALSDNFRKKLKRSSSTSKSAFVDGLSSIETLSQRAGMRADAAIIDLTNASIMTNNLEESFIECKEEDKEAYLYYILSIYGQGRTIVFCTSIAALRRISSLLRILGIHVWTLHAQMQQRARLKAIDRFRGNEHAVLVATDVAARGLDIHGVRTVVHYQLPHSAEVYIHRSGRTARASADGCCIAMISPSDKTKFVSLCKSMSKESLRQFPLDDTYMPEVIKRMSLARQIDKILRKSSQEKAKKSWFQRNAESVELAVEDSDSEDETVEGHKLKKNTSIQLKGLQQDLNDLLRRPLQPRTFSHRFLAGAGISPLVQKQLEQLSKRKTSDKDYSKERRTGLMVIGQDCIEPLQALRTSGHEVCVNLDKARETRRVAENLKRKRREEKKRTREQLRKEKKRAKEGTD